MLKPRPLAASRSRAWSGLTAARRPPELNRKTTMDSTVRHRSVWRLSRSSATCEVSITGYSATPHQANHLCHRVAIQALPGVGHHDAMGSRARI